MLQQLTVELVIHMQVVADTVAIVSQLLLQRPNEVGITVLPSFHMKKTEFQKVK